jgi:hypothetical protein
MKGTTVTTAYGQEINHPEANYFEVDGQNNLILTTDADYDGLVAMYRNDQWVSAVCHRVQS